MIFDLINPLGYLDDSQVPILVSLAEGVKPGDARELLHEAVQLLHQLSVVVVICQLWLKQLCAIWR